MTMARNAVQQLTKNAVMYRGAPPYLYGTYIDAAFGRPLMSARAAARDGRRARNPLGDPSQHYDIVRVDAGYQEHRRDISRSDGCCARRQDERHLGRQQRQGNVQESLAAPVSGESIQKRCNHGKDVRRRRKQVGIEPAIPKCLYHKRKGQSFGTNALHSIDCDAPIAIPTEYCLF